jgi:hypothetical protein
MKNGVTDRLHPAPKGAPKFPMTLLPTPQLPQTPLNNHLCTLSHSFAFPTTRSHAPSSASIPPSKITAAIHDGGYSQPGTILRNLYICMQLPGLNLIFIFRSGIRVAVVIIHTNNISDCFVVVRALPRGLPVPLCAFFANTMSAGAKSAINESRK